VLLAFRPGFIFIKSQSAKKPTVIKQLHKGGNGKYTKNNQSKVQRWHSGEGKIQWSMGNKQTAKAFHISAAHCQLYIA
jgi:hypothetical protein